MKNTVKTICYASLLISFCTPVQAENSTNSAYFQARMRYKMEAQKLSRESPQQSPAEREQILSSLKEEMKKSYRREMTAIARETMAAYLKTTISAKPPEVSVLSPGTNSLTDKADKRSSAKGSSEKGTSESAVSRTTNQSRIGNETGGNVESSSATNVSFGVARENKGVAASEKFTVDAIPSSGAGGAAVDSTGSASSVSFGIPSSNSPHK